MGAAVPAGKLALGAGAGALSGALSEDPDKLTSFINQFGTSGISGQNVSVDPGNSLATGLDLAGRGFSALNTLAAQPVDLGPASIAQTPAFAFGGALPAPLGFTVSDPGFKKPSGVDLGRGTLVDPNSNPPNRPDPLFPFGKPDNRTSTLGGDGSGGGGTSGPTGGLTQPIGNTKPQTAQQSFLPQTGAGGILSPQGQQGAQGGFGSVADIVGLGPALQSRFGLPGGGANPAGFNQFQSALNLLRLGQGQAPVTQGGFSGNQ